MATSPDSKPTERQLAALESPDAMLRDIEMTNTKIDLVKSDENLRNLARFLAEERAKNDQLSDELRNLIAQHRVATLQLEARVKQVATLAWEKEDRDRMIVTLSQRVDDLTADVNRLTIEAEKNNPEPGPPKKKRAPKKRAPKK